MALASLVVLVLAACGTRLNENPTSDAAGPPLWNTVSVVTQQGRAAAGLYFPIFVVAVAIFVLVEGLLIWNVIRYRRRQTDTELPVQTHGNNRLEILWTAIPAAIVMVFFVGSMIVLNEVQAKDPDPRVTVDVTAYQFGWTFEYRDEGLSFTNTGPKQGPEMVLPVDQPVRIRLHATKNAEGQDVGVIHSFFVPRFFYKLDVIPGRTNEFDVTVEEEGTFGGQCAEFCGLGHSDMFFTVRAVSPAAYDAWVSEEQARANATPEPPPNRPPGEAVRLELKAISVAEGFEPKELSAPADKPIDVAFTNADPAVPHNVSIRKAMPDGSDWIGQPNAEGGQSAVYQAPALPAGEYEFFCSLHPNMKGTLKVGN